MPIHDVGYRKWRGKLTATWTRWWVIAEAGIIAALKSRWVRRSLLASWLPVLYLGAAFFLLEQGLKTASQGIFGPNTTSMIANDEMRQAVGELEEEIQEQTRRAQMSEFNGVVQMFPNGDALMEAFDSGDPNEIRNRTWCWLLLSFLRYPQGIMTLLVVGLVVPPLIARDVRSKAFLLYYSRPITRFEYILGKLAIPGAVLMLITIVPTLGLYCFGVMLSPDLSVLWDTWDIPIRACVATAVGVIPTCVIALMLSSTTQESRFAGFAWFAVWGLGAVVWTVIYFGNLVNLAIENETSPDQVVFNSQWSLISLYSTIGRVQSWVFGLETNVGQALPSLIMLIVITLASFLWLYNRVSSPIRM